MVTNKKCSEGSEGATYMIRRTYETKHCLTWIVELLLELRSANDTTCHTLVISTSFSVRSWKLNKYPNRAKPTPQVTETASLSCHPRSVFMAYEEIGAGKQIYIVQIQL